MQVTDAFMRPVLVDNGGKRGGARFFHVTVREDGFELSKEWIFGGTLSFLKDLFPRWKPEYIDAVDLGTFPHAVDALDKIGYHLSAVNEAGGYYCLHGLSRSMVRYVVPDDG
jgi:hypothetical protein